MRILKGKFKGKKIYTLDREFLRPTTSKTREAIFNILENNVNFSQINFSELTFLEIFCGSAIISFEANSRGFKNIILIDQSYEIQNLFNKNIKNFFQEDFTFIKCDALRIPAHIAKADICFLDPPYNKDYATSLLSDLHQKKLLNDKAIVIIEVSKNTHINYNDEYILILEKTYGNSKLVFLSYDLG
jgi:16S rRNA (guanine966-N2)-methyltransferase